MMRFTKMHGLGNDFVVIDAIRQNVQLTPELARHLGDRHFGIGCDQILVVERPGRPEADFRYRIFNADGSEVAQCGNGARCFARFVLDQGLTGRREIAVETAGGIIHPRIEDDGQVTVDMGPPRFAPADIPLRAAGESLRYRLPPGAEEAEAWGDAAEPEKGVVFSALSMGNPHAVLEVADVAAAPVEELGPWLENHPAFPERVNVGFAQVTGPQSIALRVFERGAGETLACGTGACAAAVTMLRLGKVGGPVAVATRGGELRIRWDGEGHSVFMTGPVATVFQGEIGLDP